MKRQTLENGVEYFVKWEGLPESNNSWERAGSLTRSSKVISTFESSLQHKVEPARRPASVGPFRRMYRLKTFRKLLQKGDGGQLLTGRTPPPQPTAHQHQQQQQQQQQQQPQPSTASSLVLSPRVNKAQKKRSN